MVPKSFFEKSWQFRTGDPDAYPSLGTLEIQSAGPTTCRVRWTDRLLQAHNFILAYDGERLSSQPAVDLGPTPSKSWNFAITQLDSLRITGEVEEIEVGPTRPDEANLAGSWGAEAPPSPAIKPIPIPVAHSTEPFAAHLSL